KVEMGPVHSTRAALRPGYERSVVMTPTAPGAPAFAQTRTAAAKYRWRSARLELRSCRPDQQEAANAYQRRYDRVGFAAGSAGRRRRAEVRHCPQLQARRRRHRRAHGRPVGQDLRQGRTEGEAAARRSVVEIPGAKPGKLHLAGEYWRHAELRQPADMPPDGSVGPLMAPTRFRCQA